VTKRRTPQPFDREVVSQRLSPYDAEAISDFTARTISTTALSSPFEAAIVSVLTNRLAFAAPAALWIRSRWAGFSRKANTTRSSLGSASGFSSETIAGDRVFRRFAGASVASSDGTSTWTTAFGSAVCTSRARFPRAIRASVMVSSIFRLLIVSLLSPWGLTARLLTTPFTRHTSALTFDRGHDVGRDLLPPLPDPGVRTRVGDVAAGADDLALLVPEDLMLLEPEPRRGGHGSIPPRCASEIDVEACFGAVTGRLRPMLGLAVSAYQNRLGTSRAGTDATFLLERARVAVCPPNRPGPRIGDHDLAAFLAFDPLAANPSLAHRHLRSYPGPMPGSQGVRCFREGSSE